MKSLLLTGATGFVGKSLFEHLKSNFKVSLLLRDVTENYDSAFSKSYVGDFSGSTDFTEALHGIDCIIHLAARAHVTRGVSDNSLEKFMEANTHATLKLASQAAQRGVQRFIFISSIGVNGISNSSPFKCSDKAAPSEDYSISKHEAEIGLKKIANNTGMEVVIIRPPLVYGRGAPGNFGTLIKVAKKNLPLPLGAVNNQRSIVSIDNLIDLITVCIEHPNAANQTFLVSDDQDISTTELLKKLTVAAGNNPRLIPFPISTLKLLAKLVGKGGVVERFSSSLTIDIEHTKETLNWSPPISLDEGIRRCFK